MGHLTLMSELKGHLLCECQSHFMRTRHHTTEVELGEERDGLSYMNWLGCKKGYECEARTCCSSHWSFQTNYIHAMPKIKWQGNSAIMRFWSTVTPHEQKPWNRQFSHIWLVLWEEKRVPGWNIWLLRQKKKEGRKKELPICCLQF